MFPDHKGDFVSTFEVKGRKILSVAPEALRVITAQAMVDIAHLLRPKHLQVGMASFGMSWE